MTTDQFAIVPIPEYGPLRDTINAIAVSTGGPLATIIAGLDARADAEELLTRVGEEAERSAAELAAQESEYRLRVINDLCNGISKMSSRLKSYEKRKDEQERIARAEARKALEDSLPDPDTGEWRGEYLAPNLHPDTGDPAEDRGAYAGYPDAVGDPDPDLPEGMGGSGITGSGTMPELPEQMAHPQPSEQTPVAIGGS